MSHTTTLYSGFTYQHQLLPSSPLPSPAISFNGLKPFTSVAVSPSGFQLSPIALTPRTPYRSKPEAPEPPQQPLVSPLETPQLSFTSISLHPPQESQAQPEPTHSYTNNPHFSYYGKHLPHFHPPRYSRRLRKLITKRKKPLSISLLPTHNQPPRKAGWFGGQSFAGSDFDEDYGGDSGGSLSLRVPKGMKWATDPRVVLLVILILVLAGIGVMAWGIGTLLGN